MADSILDSPSDHDPNCIFCQIIAGNAPCRELYRDDTLIAFLDIAPVQAGHTLIVPLRHHVDMFTMNDDELAAVARLARRLAPVVKSVTGADGLGVHQLNGAAAGQTVFHYHMHLIPAFEGKPPKIHGRTPAPEEELDAMMAALLTAI